jgi:serine/threonine-protein kinase
MTVRTRGAELLGRTLGGRYRLLALVGAGASAAVYLAEDTSLRRRVAVKVLHAGLAGDEAFQKRFRAEARAAAALSHPHVLAVHDWSETDGAYLVTELLEGGSLRDLLAGGRRLSPSQALVVGLHTAQGLEYAHRHGFVHRDIKPANLLFGREGRLRIGDFGIARAVAEAAWTEPDGVLVGTARYAAPEQATAGAIDGRADVYALALTLVEAVTGEVPLIGDTPIATMALRQSTAVPVPDALGPLAEPLRRAGQVEPAGRPAAGELAVALMAAAARLERPAPLPLPGLPLRASAGEAHDRTESPRPRPVDGETEAVVLDPPPARLAVGNPPVAGDDLAIFDLDRVDPPGAAPSAPAAPPATGRRRRRWPWVALVTLLVLAGAGAAVWYREATRIPTHPVGAYVGLGVEQVRAEIEAYQWAVVELSDRRDGSVAGDVLEQAPPPGTLLAEGAELTLVVSEGPLLRAVPQLVGLERDRAEAAIGEAGLAVRSVTEDFDEDLGPGLVLAASTPPGAQLETGSPVDLVVSLGPAPRTVPDAGSNPQEVAAALEALGLVPTMAEEFHDRVPEGEVIGVSPGPGEQVERGAQVTVTVSLGRPWITVPDVVGLTAAEASDRLEAQGFVVVDTIGPPNRPVLVTDPPAGETYRKGKQVTIITRSSGG